MTQPLVIIVTGPPATGKTTLAQRVADEFRLLFFSKDGFKELLFDKLGWSDRAWSKRLGAVSYAMLFHVLEAQLRVGASCVVESNFHVSFDGEFNRLHETYGFTPFQISCVADGDVLYERFKARAESGERHPGHGDAMNIDEFEGILRRGRHDPLDIGGTIYEVDMTDLNAIDYSGLFAAIRAAKTENG